MEYTINEVAKLSGVTQRTLRHYEQVGLLNPRRKRGSGYRLYQKEDLMHLQQILFYRELDLSLATIKEIFLDPAFDLESALTEQKRLLQEKRNHLDRLLLTLDLTLQDMKGERTMTDQERFEGFKKQLVEDNERTYGKEVRERYGEETAQRANAQMMGMNEATFQEFSILGEKLLEKLSEVAKSGDWTSDRAKEVAQMHKRWLGYTWGEYSEEAHRNLVQMYVDDERFASYYQGNATFLRDAVHHYLDNN